jgi:hypothetical protein
MEKAVSDLNDVLLELRYAEVSRLPEAGDAGDDRVRESLQQEIASARHRHRPMRRRVAVGRFVVTPAVWIAVVATAAAATGGAVLVVTATTNSPAQATLKAKLAATEESVAKATAQATAKSRAEATTIFRKDPNGVFQGRRHIPKNVIVRRENVIPASVHDRAIVTVPDYGKVQFWAATTRQGGFCSAVQLPNGSWAAYPMTAHFSGGFDGGTVPGCTDTEQQRSIGELGQSSAEAPTTHEGFDDEVKTRNGQVWELFFGYVTTQGRAAMLKDVATGHTAPVTPAGYFLLAERISNASDESYTFDVLNAAGQMLQPDFSRSGLFPGYKIGPTKGPRP